MVSETFKFALTRESRKYLQKLAKLDKKSLYKDLDKFFGEQSTRIAGFISKRFLSGQRLNRRTGALARSIVGRGVRVGGIPGMRVGVFRGPALAYAGIQEHGGTIVARGKLLAVPPEGSQALTPAGVDRFGGPRNFPGKLSFVPFRRNTNVVGALYPAGELIGITSLRDAQAAYLLMRRVTIKPQHYLRDGIRENLEFIAEDLSLFLANTFSSKDRKRTGGRRRDRRGRFI